MAKCGSMLQYTVIAVPTPGQFGPPKVGPPQLCRPIWPGPIAWGGVGMCMVESWLIGYGKGSGKFQAHATLLTSPKLTKMTIICFCH